MVFIPKYLSRQTIGKAMSAIARITPLTRPITREIVIKK